MTAPPSYELCAIGNVCIDIIATVPDAFLNRHGLTKGQNNRIDAAQAAALLADLPDHVQLPGGVGANVAHVFKALGGASVYQGIGGADAYADIFEKDMQAHGIPTHIAKPTQRELGTSQVFCLGSPDGERTFASYDGALHTFNPQNLDINFITQSQITYLDCYTMLSPDTPATFKKAIEVSHAAGHLTCLNPCDVHTVIAVHPEAMRDLANRVSMVICNLAEAQALFGDVPIEQLAAQLVNSHTAGAITDGGNGAYVFARGVVVFIPPADIRHLGVVDSNGAGDHFAGGFLYGLTHGLSVEQAGILGQLCALDCLSHPGARPLGSLKHLLSALTKI